MSENNLGNLAVWMDIPVIDLDRAMVFYETVLRRKVEKETFDNIVFAVVMHESGNGACLIVDAEAVSQDHGILVYFNVDGHLRESVGHVIEAGGEIMEDIHSIGPHGFRAIICDSEGNRIALHSNKD